MDYFVNTVTLATPTVPSLAWKGNLTLGFKGVMPFLCSSRMVEKDFLSYLAYVFNTNVDLLSSLNFV